MRDDAVVDFEILIDDSFVSISTDDSLEPIDKKHVLSIVNDFEDGDWRYGKFQSFIWDNIADTALSHKERSCLVDQSHSLLSSAAKNLRLSDKETDIGKGSELAEIFLYGIMKHHFNALPVVPKIFYKQNIRDNAKGADSVHVVIDDAGDFSIWFGEAKFYNSIEDARLGSIVTSVGNSLITEKLKKENSIITNVSDIDELVEDRELRESIRCVLSNKESIDSLKPKLHVPILLLHECEITKGADCLSAEYKDQVVEYHKQRAQAYFEKQITALGESVHMYSEITFHIILFPVPEKDPIVDKFISAVEFFQGQ